MIGVKCKHAFMADQDENRGFPSIADFAFLSGGATPYSSLLMRLQVGLRCT